MEAETFAETKIYQNLLIYCHYLGNPSTILKILPVGRKVCEHYEKNAYFPIIQLNIRH